MLAASAMLLQMFRHAHTSGILRKRILTDEFVARAHSLVAIDDDGVDKHEQRRLVVGGVGCSQLVDEQAEAMATLGAFLQKTRRQRNKMVVVSIWCICHLVQMKTLRCDTHTQIM